MEINIPNDEFEAIHRDIHGSPEMKRLLDRIPGVLEAHKTDADFEVIVNLKRDGAPRRCSVGCPQPTVRNAKPVALGTAHTTPPPARTPTPTGVGALPPLVFTAENKPVDLENFYRGRSGFLICGGPSFGQVDHTKLRRPGIVTMAVNNSPKTFRPHLWTCVDNPDHFLRSIWLDPAITKFAPMPQVRARVFDSDRWEYMNLKIAECPATFFYHRNDQFRADRFLTEPTINWGNGEKTGGGRSVMLVALRLLHHLGIRRIFLLGCDFTMTPEYTYHFEQERQKGSVSGNNNTYNLLKERFKQLRPIFEAAGLRVFNCNPESGLDAFDKISFEQALDMADAEWGRINVATERTAGLYDKKKPLPPSAPVPRNAFWRKEAAIPATAHVVWLGSPLPKLAAEFIERFKKMHPGWEVKLWTEIPAAMPAGLQTLMRKMSSVHQQSDLVRLWALSVHGGICLDADIYVLRSMEEMRHYEHFILQGRSSKLSTGVMGFAKGSPLVPLLLAMAQKAASGSKTNPSKTAFGADLFTEFHQKNPGRLNVLPAHYAYIIRTQGTALDFIKWKTEQQMEKITELRGRMTDNVHPFAIHLWGFPAPMLASAKPAPQACTAIVKTPRKIVLTAPGFLGDQVVFTGVVRELKRAAPGWLVDVQTNQPDLWLHSPHITKLDRGDPCVTVFPHHYCPSFRRSNQSPMHFLELYARRIGRAVGIEIPVTEFRGDIHLSAEEVAAPPPYPELAGERYWVMVAGCKKGVPIKGWGSANYQAVVDAFRGRLLFVQVGAKSDAHPPLRHVVNLVGKTSVRDLIRLIYHAEGVLCPITSAMHLTAAVPVKPGHRKLRPCIVIAGGREPVHHIAYPGHRVLHAIGALPCCATGGCGQSRFRSKNDERGCQFPMPQPGGLPTPKCMSLISAADVVEAVETYYRGGIASLPPVLGRVQALLRRLPDSPVCGVEVGVLRGHTSSQLLRGHRLLRLTMVDRWMRPPPDSVCAKTDPNFYSRPQTQFDREYATALQATEFARDRRAVLRGESREAAKQVADGSLDFAFIDADHSYEGCRDDIAVWLPKLKPGGWLCGHDYHRPNYPLEGVKRAVDEFAARTHLKVEFDADKTWFVQLPHDRLPTGVDSVGADVKG